MGTAVAGIHTPGSLIPSLLLGPRREVDFARREGLGCGVMGQAMRRAAGRARSSPPIQSAERAPPPRAPDQVSVAASEAEGIPRSNEDSRVLEEQDPGYDAMLRKMVGTVKTKPGGKHEMGEAFIVEKYNRPMPKLRSSKEDTSGGRPLPPGTLTAVQVQEIILLHQGKSSEHQGQMEINDIAQKFKVDIAQVKRIVQFMSLPPEDNTKNNQT